MKNVGERINIFLVLKITLLLIGIFFWWELIEKTLFAHNYFQTLSQNNLLRKVDVIAPRGVFFDRDGEVLTLNKKDKIHGFVREYLYPKETAHLLGFLSLPNEVNLKDYGCGAPAFNYQYIGKAGLEKYFECRLRGKPGETIYESDARAVKKRQIAVNPAKQGENITLSLSIKLQKQAELAFKNLKGAAVATNPKTGEVLLFSSYPSFDSESFKKPNAYQALVDDLNKPLYNRLTLGIYPPGSVIKPIIALASLEEKVITSFTTFEDTGVFKFGGVSFGNWYYLKYGKKEGAVNVVKAIARSNDIFFYQTGLKLNVDKLNKWFKAFHLDGTDLINYFPEEKGVLPNAEWKKKTQHESWYLGDTVNLSIGQGYLLVNPVQMHLAISVIANNGSFCNLTFEKNSQPFCQNFNLNSTNISLVKEGMVKACETGGTAWPFFDLKYKNKKIQVACKTGTAESQQKSTEPHAWFTMFYPVEKPIFALTVFVENGGEGSDVAAPIAKKIFETYISNY